VALIAFVVLGAAYVGVYRMLTAEVRRDRDAILRRHGDGIRTAEAPAGDPPSDAVPLQKWKREQERWGERRRYDQYTKQIDTMFTALIGAFAAQTAITAVLLVKASQRRERSPVRGQGGRGGRGAPAP
jgi:hypothetical protein